MSKFSEEDDALLDELGVEVKVKKNESLLDSRRFNGLLKSMGESQHLVKIEIFSSGCTRPA